MSACAPQKAPEKYFQKNGTLDSGCPGSSVTMVAMKVEKTIKVGRPALNRAMVRRTLSAAVLAPHKALSSRFPNFISTRPPAPRKMRI